MTSKLTITDERLAELVAFKPLPGTDINSATRDEWMAMAAELQERRQAAMDSEPVADDGIFRHGDAVGVFNVGCETCPDHLVAWTVKGKNLPSGNYWLYISQQPEPVVPQDVLDALQKVARIRLDLNDFDGDRRGIADCLGDAEEALIEVVNRRAAMLQAGNSPVIPDGWTGNDKANAALMMLDRIETVDPVDDDRIDGIKRIVRELAAGPQEVK
ncbi:TPA: hypothetical protein SBQ34_000277 [Raoultella ornithinolytica]|uniref:Ead/Ea22-like family protein n=1 Tax=Raoultella ornithinolytica TaxID=54291 RepID=A0ABZ2DPE8_RAOOR|nr:hypothetical protein [Raoultella ornithinolytica]ELS0898734.1 hypothetical protein [Raoultella ornithinolytica]HAT2281290.1 hypothetical protein [Raoultella ornithinolytica]HAT2345205.1 hypothetical protein [Raoultella ornithinolytica]HAT2400340.1 hypothetical protein [Raoultella ornithinolytica]HAT2437141.1 hypothetical protein [Raoultella ornithinolytica]